MSFECAVRDGFNIRPKINLVNLYPIILGSTSKKLLYHKNRSKFWYSLVKGISAEISADHLSNNLRLN